VSAERAEAPVNGRRTRFATFALAALLTAIVFDLVVLAWGETPSAIARLLLAGTWGTGYGAGQVLFKATSILLAAVAARVALRAGLFNIGIDGAIALAALTVGGVGAALPAGVSRLVALPLLFVVALAAGAAWTLPSAILRARFGAHEVISGIMLNKIAAALVSWLLTKDWLREEGSVHTRALPHGALLPRLEQVSLFRGVSLRSLHGSAANGAIVVALALVALWAVFARRTVIGRELAAVGASPTAAEACGVPVRRHMMTALLLSGAIGGLTALNDVLGYKGYAEEGLGAGVGFAGLSAALIAGESRLGLVAIALVFGTLSQGGLAINARVPMDIVDVMVAVAILLVSTAPALRRWILRS
jgi:simple sugar transport system permease protein